MRLKAIIDKTPVNNQELVQHITSSIPIYKVRNLITNAENMWSKPDLLSAL